ncbi:Elongation factor 1-delta-like protein [Drosera capensis]
MYHRGRIWRGVWCYSGELGFRHRGSNSSCCRLEETEEEEKAAEERAAAVKASGKKKEPGKPPVLLDVKPWDDETDMQKLEEAVRSVKMEGL